MNNSKLCKFNKWFACVCTFFLLQSSSVHANQTLQNSELRRKAISHMTGIGSDYNEAKSRQLLTAASENGDILAKMWVARCTFRGFYGFAQNRQKAHSIASAIIPEIVKLSEERPVDGEISFLIGDAYLYGIGVEKNREKARHYHSLAAESGHPMAIHNVGMYYLAGKLGEVNESKGKEFITRAARLGEVHAITALTAMMIDAGQDNVDFNETFKMLLPAAQKSFPGAMLFIGFFYYEGLGVTINRLAAVNWFEKAALAGNIRAAYNAGVIYDEGDGVPVNKRKAFRLLKIAAEVRVPDAMQKVGAMYRDGVGVYRSYPNAAQYFRSAADSGHAEAAKNLGFLYLKGLGVRKNLREAKRLFEYAAQKGNKDAMFNIGLMYMHGDGVWPNDGNAFHWFREAAKAGHVKAMYNTGQFYSEGRGVRYSRNEALYWLKKAADAGHGKAKSAYYDVRNY